MLFTSYSQLVSFALFFPNAILLRLNTADFHYDLPPDLIAQHPLVHRDQSRLLVLHRQKQAITHRHFTDFATFLNAGDVLVLNNSRVIPARLRAAKPESGGRVEIFLVEELATNDWWAMLKPGKRVRPGSRLNLLDSTGNRTALSAIIQEKNVEGHCRVRFEGIGQIKDILTRIGEVPLPPYIQRNNKAPGLEDLERYQTVYAQPEGSVAAPTAGLHFTKTILEKIRQNDVHIAEVTLHVGLGTFAPVKADELTKHTMHEETFQLPSATAEIIRQARAAGKRVIAAGTTSLRVLETVARDHGEIIPAAGKTRLFVYPPCEFKVVDALLTNFHLPESTLLMLVSAFASPGSTEGRNLILHAYTEAIRERYRFFSYGDAMLIL